MEWLDSSPAKLAIALGIGLLIGAERERRKGEGPRRGAAGIRTFAIVTLMGGVVALFDSPFLLVAAALLVGAFAVATYILGDRQDPGLTTEVALLTAFLLGALTPIQPELAAGLGVTITVILASRSWMHRFVKQYLCEEELHDALILAGAALVVLPLLPDRPVGPYETFNPHRIWRLAVLVLAIQADGHLAARALGGRIGLPLAGFFSGFISSAGTIAAFGAKARAQSHLLPALAAGAVLSTLATFILMAIVLAATHLQALSALWPALAAGGGVALVFGIASALHSWREKGGPDPEPGRAFSLRAAILFALTVSAILLFSAFIHNLGGEGGLLFAAALGGLADVHASTISVASMVADGKIATQQIGLPILAALSSNALTKIVLAWTQGGSAFAWRVIPGIVFSLLAAWIGLWLC